MKKLYSILPAVLLLSFMLTGCGAQSAAVETPAPVKPEVESAPVQTPAETTEEQPALEESQASRTLIVYFSCTGGTKGVAEKIAEITGGDFFEIVPVVPYTAEDLNYNDRSTRATAEQYDKTVRPEISNAVDDWDQYDTIYLGHPIWWGEEPRILDTFAESYDFSGKTVIPFCTSGSSGVGNSAKNMEQLAGAGVWAEGKRFPAGASAENIQSWIDSLGLE